MITIIGASGNTGGGIAEILLNKGKKIRVIGRNAENLKKFTDKGADSAIGDILNPEFLSNAFKGSKAVYVMIPPYFGAENVRAYQNEVSTAIVNAIISAGVKNVIMLSSIGAHLTEGAGVVQGLYDFEQKLNALLGINCVYLRAGFFMENSFGSINMIKEMGIYGMPLRPDVKMAFVATKDIAEMGAKYLLDMNFKGKTIQYVLGPKDYTPSEFTKIIGTAIGNPKLSYVQFPYEDSENAMAGVGMSSDMAKSMVQLMRALNDGKIYDPEWRNSTNTTNTSVEEFSKLFSAVYSS